MRKAPSQGACPRGIAVRKPSDHNPLYCTSVHKDNVDVHDIDDQVEQPISGRLGPGTVISAAVDASLWPAWTDLPLDVVIRNSERGY